MDQMPNFLLSEAQSEFRAALRQMCEERIAPFAAQVDADAAFPWEGFKAAVEMELPALGLPVEYGGAGADHVTQAIMVEELARVCASTSVTMLISKLGMIPLMNWGSEELKRRYLPSMCTGERVGAFALTEPNAGSDAVHIQVAALRDHDGFRLNGTKLWVTNGPIADLLTVFAVTDREKGTHGITAFVVETDQPGVQVGKIDEKMGLHGSLTSEIIFDGALVPAENLIGEEGRGFRVAMQTLDSARVALGASAVGQAQAMLDRAVSWSKQRIQFGKPLAANQAIQWMLADSEVDIHAGRMMVYNAAWKIDAGQRASHEAAMVKLYCAEMANRVADRCVQVHGGMGYMKELDIERFYRDARILRIYEGTSEVQRMIIAADLLED